MYQIPWKRASGKNYSTCKVQQVIKLAKLEVYN